MKGFKEFYGKKIMINVPEKKESVIELTAKDEESMMQDAMKLWKKLTVYAVGSDVEKNIVAGDEVYVATYALSSAERVEINGGMKMIINEPDVILTW